MRYDICMRVLTVVTQVPDAEERIAITDGKVDRNQCKASIDTMDEYGVEEALRLREAGQDIEIVALAVGPQRTEEVLRTALALGADSGVHIETDTDRDVIGLSAAVAAIAQKENATLIFCGGQQADSDSQALGPAVAERLGWPQITWTTSLTMQGDMLTGKHDVDLGIESFTASLPAVVTTQQGLNEPRYPTLPNIMKARKKEIRKETVDSLGIKSKSRVIKAEMQPRERLRKIVQGKDTTAAAAQLVQFLRNEAKVIQ